MEAESSVICRACFENIPTENNANLICPKMWNHEKAQVPASERLAALKKIRPTIVGPIILFLVGLSLVVEGCSVSFGADSASHQTYGAINYCSGFILIAAAFILDALRVISKNQ
jgi:hypothetical protein